MSSPETIPAIDNRKSRVGQTPTGPSLASLVSEAISLNRKRQRVVEKVLDDETLSCRVLRLLEVLGRIIRPKLPLVHGKLPYSGPFWVEEINIHRKSLAEFALRDPTIKCGSQLSAR